MEKIRESGVTSKKRKEIDGKRQRDVEQVDDKPIFRDLKKISCPLLNHAV